MVWNNKARLMPGFCVSVCHLFEGRQDYTVILKMVINVLL